jgi:hypothetical protein
VSEARDIALRDLNQLIEGAERLRAQLREKEAVFGRVAASIEQGIDVATAMKSDGVERTRQELTEALEEFEKCRHRSRLSLTAAGLEEGMNIGQLGRAWGFSRQLAARYAKEVRG